MWYYMIVAGVQRAQVRIREEWLALLRQSVCESIAPHDLRIDEDQGRGEVSFCDLGVVRIACGTGGRLHGEAIRTPRLIRASDPDLCKIDVQLRGRAVVGQDDRQARLVPGAFTFVDLSRPSMVAGEIDRVAAVMFPRSLLPLRYRDTQQLAGVVFHPREAGTALVATLVGQLAGRPNTYTPQAGTKIGGAIFDLILAVLSQRLDRWEAIAADTRLRALSLRVNTFIEQRLGEPGLSPTQIAAAHHISLRHLYRIFEAQRSTVGSWIRNRRLDHCRQDLTDPALANRPVSAVGARWGFVDATHFARVFKAEFGVTPSEYRSLCKDSL